MLTATDNLVCISWLNKYTQTDAYYHQMLLLFDALRQRIIFHAKQRISKPYWTYAKMCQHCGTAEGEYLLHYYTV